MSCRVWSTPPTPHMSSIATDSPMGLWDSLCILCQSGQKRISWDIPHHPTQIPTVHPIPMTHRDGTGLPGMSHTILPRSQLSIPSRWPIGMGRDYLGCPIPSYPDPYCPSHPDDPSGWDGITWDVPNHPTQIPTVHPIPMTHRDGTGLPGMSPTIQPRSQLSIPSRWPIGMGRGYLGCPQPSNPDPNCPSYPNDTSGWDGITWDVPNHPTQIPTDYLGCPQPSHPDPNGLPGMSPTIPPRSQRITWDVPNHPTQIPTDYLGCPQPSHPDPNGLPGMSPTIPPRSQRITWKWNGWGHPRQSHPVLMGHRDGMDSWDQGPWRWDGWGHPRQSHPVPMGHQDGMDSWDKGPWRWDGWGHPRQSRWDVGMGWTVGFKAPGGGMVGDIPGSPIQSRWDVGMGWTVGIKAPGGGMVGDIPGSPDGTSGWDGQLG